MTTLTIADPADAWAAVGFAVDGSGRLTLGSTVIELTGGRGGVTSWSFEPAPAGPDLAGIPLTPAVPPPTVPPEHPNGICTFDHIVLLSDDCRETRTRLEAAGFPARRERTTTRNEQEMLQIFFWAGDVIVELMGPARAERSGNGAAAVFGLALVSPDLAVTASAMGEHLGTTRPAMQAGRSIATIRTRAAGISVPLAVMSPHPG